MVFLSLRRERRWRAERIVLLMGLFECVEEMEEAVEGLLVCCIVVVMLRGSVVQL